MIFYCMNCWAEIAEDCGSCPKCGAFQEELLKEDFNQKLIRALSHPEPETVLRAIEIIGNRKCNEAMPFLKNIITEHRDPFRTAQALEAFLKLESPNKIEFIREYTDQKYGFIIAKKARELLQKQM